MDVIALETTHTGKSLQIMSYYLQVLRLWPPLLAMVLLDLTTVSSAVLQALMGYILCLNVLVGAIAGVFISAAFVN